MEDWTLEVRIAVLRLFIAVAMSAHNALASMQEEVAEQVREMKMGSGI